jgi:ATP-dependent helicase/nuclease subunit B
VVVVPGMVEKEFPLRRRQDPILLDRERAALNRLAGDDPLRALPLRAVGIEEERLLFRLALRSASDFALLSYPRLDPATARPRIPSIFVLSTVGQLDHERRNYETLESSPHVKRISLSRRFPPDRADALTRDEFDGCSILAALAARDSTEVAYLVRGNAALARGLEMEETRWTSPFFTRFDGMIETQDALAAARELSSFGPDGPQAGTTVSATALEEYAACPFRFFMHHVLGIEPIDEPDEALELSPLDRGTLYHAVLETFGRRMRERGRLPFRTEAVEDLFAVLDETLARGPWAATAFAGAESLTRQDLVWNLIPWLVAEAEDDTGLVPAYFEARFGGKRRGREDADLVLEGGVAFDAGTVHVGFGGRIDRIDVSVDGRRARVIDYKTGGVGRRNAVFDRGRRLQLPIYVIAARELLRGRHPGIAVASAEYRYIAAPGTAPISFEGDELDEHRGELALAVSLIVSGIATGKFFAYPTDKKACANCDYADACQSTAVALAAMKNGDRKASFYVEGLAGIE